MSLLKATSGMKSGRTSVTGVKDAGKASRNSTKRISAKSSVTRSQLEYKQLQQMKILEYQEHKQT